MSQREQVKTRTREPDPLETEYDRSVREKELRNQGWAEGKVITKGKDLPWELNRQGRIKHFLSERSGENLAAPGWVVFQHEIRKHSGLHRHQGGTFLYVVEGKGYSTVNGVRYDWESGDLIMLPMMPGGVAHQHFNLDPGVPAIWMKIGYSPHKDPVVANWIEQLELSPEWAQTRGVGERKVAATVDHARTAGAWDPPRDDTLFDALIRLRDEQRRQVRQARMVIRGKELPREANPMGLFRWYIHPLMKDVGCRSQITYTQEIPPASRSGKQLHQGGRFHYVLQGSGFTIVDGVRHDWEKDDIILLPVKSHGVIHQHFNPDPREPALLVVAEPNWVEVWGVDLGSGFEMLEPSPDYRAPAAGA
jgi:quercetin dioxygenase-like cupin family protein